MNSENATDEFLELKRLAEQGDSNAQVNLGNFYADGKDITDKRIYWLNYISVVLSGRATRRNYDKALEWYQKAAYQGNAGAQYNLARMYADGLGTKRDYKKAFDLYLMSAMQGLESSQYIVGWMYQRGHGVTRDLVQSYKWLSLAALQGHCDAEKLRKTTAKNIKRDKIAEAEKLVQEWQNSHQS